MNIYVCVGSSCHLRGSYNIISLMKECIANCGLSEEVKLSASFCLGKCTDGVSIKINDQIICGVCPENFHEIFKEHVLNRIER